MESSFSYLYGQQILESLTFDQATYPATALQGLQTVFSPSTNTATPLRVTFLLTDGLTTETRCEDYHNVLEKTDSYLILLLTTNHREGPLRAVCRLERVRQVVLGENADLHKLVEVLSSLVETYKYNLQRFSMSLPASTPHLNLRIM